MKELKEKTKMKPDQNKTCPKCGMSEVELRQIINAAYHRGFSDAIYLTSSTFNSIIDDMKEVSADAMIELGTVTVNETGKHLLRNLKEVK